MENENADIKKIIDEMWQQPIQFYNEPKTVDLTPTWSSLFVPLVDLLTSSYTAEDTKAYVVAEFRKMAQAADAHIASQKKIEIINNKLGKAMYQHTTRCSELGDELLHIHNMLTNIHEK